MNNDEIKALLRELSAKADAEGRSRVVDITFDKKKPANENDGDRSEPGQGEGKKVKGASAKLASEAAGKQDKEQKTTGRKRKGFFAAAGSVLGRREEEPEDLPEEEYLDEPEEEEEYISVLPRTEGRYVLRAGNHSSDQEKENTGNSSVDSKTATGRGQASVDTEEGPDRKKQASVERKTTADRKQASVDAETASDRKKQASAERETTADRKRASVDAEAASDRKQESADRKTLSDRKQTASHSVRRNSGSMKSIRSSVFEADFDSDADDFRSESTDETEEKASALGLHASEWISRHKKAAEKHRLLRTEKNEKAETESEDLQDIEEDGIDQESEKADEEAMDELLERITGSETDSSRKDDVLADAEEDVSADEDGEDFSSDTEEDSDDGVRGQGKLSGGFLQLLFRKKSSRPKRRKLKHLDDEESDDSELEWEETASGEEQTEKDGQPDTDLAKGSETDASDTVSSENEMSDRKVPEAKLSGTDGSGAGKTDNSDRSDTEQPEGDPSGADGSGAGKTDNTDRSGTEQSDRDQSVTDGSGAGKTDNPDRSGTKQSEGDQSGADGSGEKLSEAEMPGAEVSDTEKSEKMSDKETAGAEKSDESLSEDQISYSELSDVEEASGQTADEELSDRQTADAAAGRKNHAGFHIGKYLKKIGGSQKILVGFAVVLFILIAVMAWIIFRNSSDIRNASSQDGLTVTVKKEPEEWCTSGTVTLGIRASSQIQSVSVNGETQAFDGGKSGNITLEATSQILNVMVVTEEKVLNAEVPLQKVDSEDPVLNISSANEMVTLEASDTGSGVEGIYYGVVEGLSDVAEYQQYTEPFVPEEGKIYSCYAKDCAGNTTNPTVTDFEPAQSISLSSTEITLFPGQSFRLTAETVPANAYVNGLEITGSNDNVISVSSSGLITALAEGDATVGVTAPGMTSLSCVVRVRSEIDVTVSALGDITLGDDVSFSADTSFSSVAQAKGMNYFFANVRSILSEDDITFGNLEGTLTDQGVRENKTYAFRGDPSYTQILTYGSVEAVTLANNHSSDYGEVSLTDTEQYLTDAGIDYCIDDKIIIKEVKGVKVGLIGIYALDEGTGKVPQVKSTIADAQAQGAQIIIVAFHWGTEKDQTPDDIQKTLAHTAIDCGADLVVGHHPHVLQGTEEYKGKHIAYSLGNFCFGGNSSPSDMDTVIYQETFHITSTGEISGTTVNIIPCTISSDTTLNNYQPTPAEGEKAEEIMAKINAAV